MNKEEIMIKISKNVFINKYQIISIEKFRNFNDFYLIKTTKGEYTVYDYSEYYRNIYNLIGGSNE